MQAEALADTSLKRALGPLNLTMLGIGAIVGAGIFVLTGTAAARHAGPAVVLSFALAGVVSAFAALCYSEFASLVPKAGSAYTYGYVTLGEFFAWIIGWDLILEYAVGAIAVSVSWSGYLVSFLKDFGIIIPPEYSAAHGTRLIELPAALAAAINIKAGWQPLSENLLGKITRFGHGPLRHTAGCLRVQLPRHHHHRHYHHPAGDWDQGVGQLQQSDCDREARRGLAVYWRSVRRDQAGELAALYTTQCWRVGPLRVVRCHAWRQPGLLRVHRLRRGQHRRAGSQKSAARHAHRHHRLPSHLYRPLPDSLRHCHRCCSLRRTRCPRTDRQSRRPRGHGLDGGHCQTRRHSPGSPVSSWS